MKIIILAITFCFAFSSFSQERVKREGLNKFIPDNAAFGLKSSANYYFPTYTIDLLEAVDGKMSSVDFPGASLGFYYRWDFSNSFSLQPEFNIAFRAGNTTIGRTYLVDTIISVQKEKVFSYKAVSVEIPIYLKWRTEFILNRRGHYKSKSALSAFLGPRVILTPYSEVDPEERANSVIYDQPSEYYTTSLSHEKYSPIASMGASAGVDMEWRNGFLVHASFYRGFLSHSRKSAGFKALDNRIEVGIGLRFM